MSTAADTIPKKAPARRSRPKASVAAYGEPMVWLAGGALCVCLFMIVGLLTLIFAKGITTFWPKSVYKLRLVDEQWRLGEVKRSETYNLDEETINSLGHRERALGFIHKEKGELLGFRRLVRIGNFEVFNRRFEWVDNFSLDTERYSVHTLGPETGLEPGKADVTLVGQLTELLDRMKRAEEGTLEEGEIAPTSTQLEQLAEIKVYIIKEITEADNAEAITSYVTKLPAIDAINAGNSILGIAPVQSDDKYVIPQAVFDLLGTGTGDVLWAEITRGEIQVNTTWRWNTQTKKLESETRKNLLWTTFTATQEDNVNTVIAKQPENQVYMVTALVREDTSKETFDDAIFSPKQGVLIERRKNGVFLGMPAAGALNTDLSDMINAYKDDESKGLWGSIQVKLADVEELISLADAWGRSEEFEAVLASDDAFKFREKMLTDGSNTLVIVIDQGERKYVSLEEAIKESHLVIGMVDVWSDYEGFWNSYNLFRSDSISRYNSAEHIREASRDMESVEKRKYRNVEIRYYTEPYRWNKSLEPSPNPTWMEVYDQIQMVDIEIDQLKLMRDYYKELGDPDKRVLNETIDNINKLEASRDRRLKELEVELVSIEVTEDAPPVELQEARKIMFKGVMEASVDAFKDTQEINKLDHENSRYEIVVQVIMDQEYVKPTEEQVADLISKDYTADYMAPYKKVQVSDVIRIVNANDAGTVSKASTFVSRWYEFIFAKPRESNTEGGVFPAIFGTVVMTMLMVIVVVPFGVMAALYLREYAKAGPIISVIRIAINNLAGVPSIVYGVFGFGFFCYLVGGFIDGGTNGANIDGLDVMGFSKLGAVMLWVGIIVVCLISVAAAVLVGILSLRSSKTNKNWFTPFMPYAAAACWALAGASLVGLVVYNPLFNGFYQEQLPNPKFGKGGLIWASLTLALLTLPVVIVATEEALSAVPNSMREGSYACGASKWQTIKRIVLPRAMPGIMTGMILAMARGAGEVAPLMLVGAVKFVDDLPLTYTLTGIQDEFPTFGVNRSFMHLGFHIYDVAFQSPDSEAAKPMVFTTTLLLITIIAMLNVAAILIRAKLRKKFAGNQF